MQKPLLLPPSQSLRKSSSRNQARVEFRISMQTRRIRFTTAAIAIAVAVAATLASNFSHAARVAILSNNHATETAADFGAKIPGHTFTPINVSGAVPSLASLTTNYDVLLLFEDSTFANAPLVGNVVAGFASTGRAVVLGTFYDQDRTDGPPAFSPNGWGPLENLDPNTTDGVGTPYAPRTLDPASIAAHPLTAGVTTLFSDKWAGGNQAKAGTVVVANWLQKNAKNNPDPAIAYRITGAACVIHIAIAPDYPTIAVASGEFGGDFYRAWHNAFDFGASGCKLGPAGDPTAIPALSPVALALTALLLLACGGMARRLARR
jgi:hypothetical protein